MQTRTVEITAHLNKGVFGEMERTKVTFKVEKNVYGPIDPIYPEWLSAQVGMNEDVKQLISEGWTREGSSGHYDA